MHMTIKKFESKNGLKWGNKLPKLKRSIALYRITAQNPQFSVFLSNAHDHFLSANRKR